VALLEADVALSVVKKFIGEVLEEAQGQAVLESITPGQMMVKIVYDRLVALLDHPHSFRNLRAPPPILLCAWVCRAVAKRP